MPVPIVVPIVGALGLAILSDALQQKIEEKKLQKSIEICTANCSAQWLKEDGVVRVYHEHTELQCARIVVEISPMSHFRPPGDIQGHPVLVRLNPTVR